MPVEHISAKPWTGREDPEDGPSARRLHHLASDTAKLGLLGFACEAGVIRNRGRVGAAAGPDAIRAALRNLSAPPEVRAFSDLGDISVTGDDLEAGQAALGRLIATSLEQFERLIVLGGGHETAYGSYLGLSERFPGKRIGIINLDAHLDIRLTGVSGPSSGTPFAQIREHDPDQFDYLCLGVAEESNTPALFARADDWGVGIVSDHALIDNPKAADQAIQDMARRSELLYLTIDLDVMPHYQAPGVSAPAIRGVPFSTLEHLVAAILSASELCASGLPLIDFVELCPRHDTGGVTARSAAILARQFI
ncbi:MAG: formimidoylglutamase [Henriciella sp.]|nr:formimidoylglutamase [Henriciella sp.]